MHNSLVKLLLIPVILICHLVDAETYNYDSAGRLTKVSYIDGSSISYAYDANGSRLSSTVAVNQIPLANNDSSTTAFETAVTVDIVANDTDSDGTIDGTTVSIVTDVTNGGTSVNATTGVVIYTPNAGFSGMDTFTYTVNDNEGATSNTATVSITVDAPPPNQVPVANNDGVTTNFDTAITVSVLTNDTDADGTLDVATVTIGTDVQNGTTTVAANGQVTYTATTGFSGTDSFTYTVMDDDGATSNSATVSITVNAAPPPSNGGGGGSMGAGLLLLLFAGLGRRNTYLLKYKTPI